MYKVFVKDKQIVFNSNQHFVNKEVGNLTFSFFSKEMVPQILSLLESNSKLKTVVFIVDDIENVFHEFCSCFTLIEAAGGVVKNKKNQTLVIYRLGKWDLPKGKIEPNERIETAAIREVEEECAVTDLSIVKQLNDCYHVYHLDTQPILKRTYWFEMQTEYDGELKPQEEEGIDKVVWMSDDEINEIVMKNTYASIADFISKL